MSANVSIPLDLFVEIMKHTPYLTLKRMCVQDKALYNLCTQEPGLSIMIHKRKEHAIQLARRHISTNNTINWGNVVSYDDEDVIEGLLALGYLQHSSQGVFRALEQPRPRVKFAKRIIQALIAKRNIQELQKILKFTMRKDAWPQFTNMILESGLDVPVLEPSFEDVMYDMFKKSGIGKETPGLRW